MIYQCFINNLVQIEYSNEKNMLIEYFSREKNLDYLNLNLVDFKIDKKKDILKEKMLDFFNIKFINLFKKNDEYIKKYVNKANQFIKLIFREEKIRIPILGCYNAGKSNLINSFKGDDLLPVDEDECTRTLICIRYYNTDEPILYRAYLKSDDCGFNHYFLVNDNSLKLVKKKGVKEYLEAHNKKNRQNKTYDFSSIYVLLTKIKILDELDISEEIKYKIEFFDMPGIKDSEYIFKKNNTIENIIRTSSSFIIVNPIDKRIEDKSSYEIISKIIDNLKVRFLNKKDNITRCLFILNKCDLKDIKIDLEKYKNNLAKALSESSELIQAEKYSAKEFIKFQKKKEYYENFDINKFRNEYNKKFLYNNTFGNYIKEEVKKQFKRDFLIEEIPKNNIILNNENNKQFDKIKKLCNNKIDNNEINEIISYLDYARRNIEDSITYKKSNAKNVLPIFKDLINKSFIDLNKNVLKLFNSFLKNDLEIFFCRDKTDHNISLNKIQTLSTNIENISLYIETIFKESNINNLCETTNKIIEEKLKEYEDNALQKLNLYNNNAENAINDLIREINEKLNNFIAQIKSEFENLLNQIIQKLQEMEGLIRDNINFSFKILNQFNDSFFKKNKILLGSIAGETVITTAALGISSELSSSIAFVGLMGGLIGLGVGAVVGGIILGIRTIYKKIQKNRGF